MNTRITFGQNKEKDRQSANREAIAKIETIDKIAEIDARRESAEH
jgi:hypothetical protein